MICQPVKLLLPRLQLATAKFFSINVHARKEGALRAIFLMFSPIFAHTVKIRYKRTEINSKVERFLRKC